MKPEEKVRIIQKMAGLTQEKLAATLEVSFATLNSWINGKSIPRKKAQARIDELFLRLSGQFSHRKMSANDPKRTFNARDIKPKSV